MPRKTAGLLLVAALTLTSCGESMPDLNRLAARGEISESAPSTAHVQGQIAAPVDKVWAILIDANAWPKWQKQIESVDAPGPLAGGRSFTWKAGVTIHSQVQLFEPERRLAWTGTAMGAKAVHVWELEATADGRTVVKVKESMDGFLIGTIFPSKKLAEMDQDWLAALKVVAEK